MPTRSNIFNTKTKSLACFSKFCNGIYHDSLQNWQPRLVGLTDMSRRPTPGATHRMFMSWWQRLLVRISCEPLQYCFCFDQKTTLFAHWLPHVGMVCYFPTLTCGVFVFSSVSAPRPPPPPSRPPFSLTHALTHSHSLTHTHSLSLTHTHSHSLTLTHSHTHSSSLTHTHTHSLSLTHSQDNVHCQGVGCTPWGSAGVPGSPPLLRGRRGTMCTAKGSDVRPGIPWAPPPLRGRRGTMCILRGRCGTMCIAKGSDVRPGVPWVSAAFAWQAWDNVHCRGVGCMPWRPLGLRLFCVAGVAQCALPRGRMYALASLGSPPLLRGRRGTMCTAKGSDVRPGVPWVSAAFAWQAWDNVHCQGVGCTPWRPLGLRRFCVAGVAQCALPRNRPGVPWVSASFAWQAWDNVHCQGVGCMPWRPLGLRLFCVAGVAQCALPRGRMYALASLGSPPLLRGRRGTMCTAKGSDVRPGVPWVSASFAWQAWDNVHCQGVGCTP